MNRPLLFNIVADMLAILIERAKTDGQIEGVIPHLVEGVYESFNTLMIQFYLGISIFVPSGP
jgi:hypothetical protein